jgi:hypothetical protein
MTPSTTGMIVRGATGQSGNLLELQNSLAAPRFTVGPTGNTTIAGTLTLNSVAQGIADDSVLLINTSNQVTRTTRASLIASSAWALNGNAGTTASSALGAAATGNFVGTTDVRSLSLVTNNVVRAQISSSGTLSTQSDVVVNGVTVGRGANGIETNTSVGIAALSLITTGTRNVAIGDSALVADTTFTHNTMVGSKAGRSLGNGGSNTAIGASVMMDAGSSLVSSNVAMGVSALRKAGSTGATSENVAIGWAALLEVTSGSNNIALGRGVGGTIAAMDQTILIGSNSQPAATAQTNQIVIGHGATGLGSNSVLLGNSSITATRLQGRVGIGADPTVAAGDAQLQVTAAAAANRGITIRGAASQSANLLDVQNNLGTTMVSVGASGLVTATAGATITGTVTLNTVAQGVAADSVLLINSSNQITRTTRTALFANSGWALTGNGITDPSTQFLGTTSAQPLVIRTNNTETMRITSAGNVGVGTTNPLNALHVAGTAAIGAGYNIYYWQPSAGDKVLQLSSQTTPTAGTGSVLTLGGRYSTTATDVTTWGAIAGFKENAVNSDGDGYLAFFTSKESQGGSFERMRITSDGSVGIGVFPPTTRLDVSGTFRATGNATIGGTLGVTGIVTASSGVNLSGAASPLQANGSAGTTGQVLVSAGAGATPTWTSITGLQLFEETLHTAAPNATVNALRWRPKSGTGTTDVDVVLSPKGAGALQAHVADGTAAGGNKRGQYAVDLQMQRWTNTAVASGVGSFIGGGHGNTASGFFAAVVGGNQNGAIGNYSFVGSGEDVQAQGQFSVAVGGIANQAPGDYSAILGGSDNQATGTNSSILGGYGLTLSGNYSAGFNGSGSRLSVSAASTYVLGNVNLWLANTDNTARELRFYEAQSTTDAFPATGTNYTAFKAGAQSADITYTLPTTSGTNGHVLTTNGTGTLSWTSAQSAAGIKSKGRSVALSAASTYVITGLTNVDTDDGVSIVLESDLDDMDIPPYFIKRVASPTAGSITVRFSAPFTGFVTWVVVD